MVEGRKERGGGKRNGRRVGWREESSVPLQGLHQGVSNSHSVLDKNATATRTALKHLSRFDDQNCLEKSKIPIRHILWVPEAAPVHEIKIRCIISKQHLQQKTRITAEPFFHYMEVNSHFRRISSFSCTEITGSLPMLCPIGRASTQGNP